MAERVFLIGEGGPFHHALVRLGLRTPDGGAVRGAWFVAFAWVPLMVGAAIRWIAGISADPVVHDISVHTRLLIALPVILATESLMTRQCKGVVLQLYRAPVANPEVLDRLLDGAERRRDSPWVELAIAATAVVMGQLVLWGVIGSTGVFSGVEESTFSLSRVWYAAIALPLLQFLMVRWLWRWAIWNIFLVQLSREPLATIATHPDRAAGLSILASPLTSYIGFVFAQACIISGAWATQLLGGRETIPRLLPTLGLFLLAVIAIGCGPLLVFCGHLFRSRRFTLADYNPLTREYMTKFHAKWVTGPRTEAGDILGTSDIQSLADIGNAYNVIVQSRVTVFSLARLRNIAFAAVLPMLPLIATVVPMENLIRRLASALFGVKL